MHREKVIYIEPLEHHSQETSSLELQIEECLGLIDPLLIGQDLSHPHILKQTVFLYSENNNDFSDRKALLKSKLKAFYGSAYPPTAFIGEPPASGALLAIELTVITDLGEGVKIVSKDTADVRYLTVTTSDYKMVYSSGLSCDDFNQDIFAQSQIAFSMMKQILDQEQMDFSQVIRQWNYIENITERVPYNNVSRQNYQMFNDARSIFYDQADFINGYPAATGIGMNAGGVVLEFIALDIFASARIEPLKNPGQVDAHRYSQDVLIGKEMNGLTQKTTPKFERAKAVVNSGSLSVYISGTAAIQGQKTIASREAAIQTGITIDNINKLVSADNLKSHGIITDPALLNYSHIRVYIKHKEDISKIKEVCHQYYEEVPALFLVADVCRDSLLVEIEGAIVGY
jgi:enamine deaminase RidA (YjgF/YER057c/UK114 family)